MKTALEMTMVCPLERILLSMISRCFCSVLLTLLCLFPAAAFAQSPQLFVSDFFQNAIKRYDGSTGAFLGTLVAPNSGGLNGPIGTAFGSDGILYVSSVYSNAVKRYDSATGAFLGDLATAANGVNAPDSLLFAANGNLLVSNSGSNVIQRYDVTTNTLLGNFGVG